MLPAAPAAGRPWAACCARVAALWGGLPRPAVLGTPKFPHSKCALPQLSCGRPAACASLALSADGRFLLTAAERAVRLWDYAVQASPSCQVCVPGRGQQGGGQPPAPRADPARGPFLRSARHHRPRCTLVTRSRCGLWPSPPTSSSSSAWETPSSSGTFWFPVRGAPQKGKCLPSLEPARPLWAPASHTHTDSLSCCLCSVQGAPGAPLTCEVGEWPHHAGRPCGDPWCGRHTLMLCWGPRAELVGSRGLAHLLLCARAPQLLSTAWLLYLQTRMQNSWRAWHPGPEGPSSRCPCHPRRSRPGQVSVLGPLRALMVRAGVLGGGGSLCMLYCSWPGGGLGAPGACSPTAAVSPTSPGALFPSDESRGPEDPRQASGPSVMVQKEAGRAGEGACGVTGSPRDLGRRPHPCGWPSKQAGQQRGARSHIWAGAQVHAPCGFQVV